MKRALFALLLALGGCAAPGPQVVRIPVPVPAVCPAPKVPPKPDLSALAALKPSDPPQRVLEVMTSALRALAQDDLELRALLGNPQGSGQKP